MTTCNYCKLEAIKKEAAEKEATVELRPSVNGGIDVYFIPKGDAIPESASHKRRGRLQRSWFFKIPAHCVCSSEYD